MNVGKLMHRAQKVRKDLTAKDKIDFPVLGGDKLKVLCVENRKIAGG